MVNAVATKKRTTAPVAVSKKIEKVASRASLASDSTAADDKSARKHLTSVLGIHISQARCEKYLKSIINDPSDVAEHKRLKAYLSTNNHKETVKEIQREIDGLRREARDPKKSDAERKLATKKADARPGSLEGEVRNAYDAYVAQQKVVERIIRLSKDVPVAVATVGDYIVKDLITFAMDYVLTNTKNRTVEIHHLFTEGYEDTQVYPIVRSLKTFEKYAKDPELHKRAKKAKDDTPAEGSAGTPVTPKEDDASTDSDDGTVNFERYIHNLIRLDIKTNERYEKIRVSRSVKTFMSDLIVDLLDRVGIYSNIVVHDLTYVRTLNSSHLINIIKLMIAGGDPNFVVFNEINKNISSKLTSYHQHSKPKKAVEAS